jgi:hypothetical protein
VPALSEWLQLMLAEIARKREMLECARTEAAQRELECGADEPACAQQQAARSHTQSAPEAQEAQELTSRAAQR